MGLISATFSTKLRPIYCGPVEEKHSTIKSTLTFKMKKKDPLYLFSK